MRDAASVFDYEANVHEFVPKVESDGDPDSCARCHRTVDNPLHTHVALAALEEQVGKARRLAGRATGKFA